MTIASPLIFAADAQPDVNSVLTEFTADSEDFGWYVVNDNVMGGRSSGGFDIDNGVLHFAGRTNTNGGGFSSIRSRPLQVNLSEHDGISLRVKGDGRRYTWRLTTGARWRGREIGYWADFDTSQGEWLDVEIPFSRFTPRVRGYRLDGPALDASRITGMGLMIYDNEDGPFELYVERAGVYTANEPFSLADYRWTKRVLVLSAPDENDNSLQRQFGQLAMSTTQFADRDLTMVTLLDDGESIAGDRGLEPDEVAAVRAATNIKPGGFALRLIGKDGSVKLARDDVTPMHDIYALIDTMPMRMREVASRR